jgi:hypothetical protein
MSLQRLFTEHPASVGETYWEHLLRACWFSGRMVLAGGACFVHAIFPFLFVKTGSQAITLLYSEMVASRNRRAAASQPVDLAAQGQLRAAK